jgi:hypothetical protein
MSTKAISDDAEMFELAPVSLWLEDYSGLHALFQRWRAAGVSDLRRYLREDLARVAECSRELRVLKVNRRTLDLYEATDAQHLIANLERVFRDAMHEPHIEELVSLWDGQLGFASETVNYSLSGQRLDILVHGRVLPGHEAAWDRVLVAIENVSEACRRIAPASTANAMRAACSSTRRSRCGWKTSARSSGCSTTCGHAASKTSASSPRCTRSSRSAACRRSASST